MLRFVFGIAVFAALVWVSLLIFSKTGIKTPQA